MGAAAASEPRRPAKWHQLAAAFLCGAVVVTLLLLLAPQETCRGPGCQQLTRLQPPDMERSVEAVDEDQPLARADAVAVPPPLPPLPPHIEQWRGLRPPPLPWPPLLSPSQLRRGLGFYGSGARIERLVAALMGGAPITAVIVGGSISRGAGSSREEYAFPARFFTFLNATWPHRGHVFLNKAVGGTSSGLFATCAESLVPPEADLIVLEFTFNEPASLPYTDPHRRGFEQLLRKLARLPRAPAVLVLHHYAWHFSAGDGRKAGLFYRDAETQISTMAQYYDMPSPSLRNALYHAMQAGAAPFKVGRVHKEVVTPAGVRLAKADAKDKASFFFYDAIHPADAGHQALAELLVGVVQAAARNVADAAAAAQVAATAAAGSEVAETGLAGASAAAAEAVERQDGGGGSKKGQKPQQQEEVQLPPPMIPGNAAHSTSLCAMQEAFKPLAVAMQGFEYAPERPAAATLVEQKWGYRGERPGAWIELEFSTAEGSGAPAGGSGAEVILGYLRSYQKMGLARVECRSGCTCPPSVMDGLWGDHTSLQQMHSFRASQAQRCRLRVTIVPRGGGGKGGGAAGDKFQLSAAMVAHAPVAIGTYARQVADFNKLV